MALMHSSFSSITHYGFVGSVLTFIVIIIGPAIYQEEKSYNTKLNELIFLIYNQCLMKIYEEWKWNKSNINMMILKEVDENDEWSSDDENIYESDDSLT